MSRSVPRYQCNEFAVRQCDYCVCVFVINEGEKFLRQLEKMQSVCRGITDIVVADGGSTDGSTDHVRLKKLNVNALLVKTDSGKLGSQMRMAFDWALNRGYKGVVCVDGNGKDGVEAIPDFVRELQNGVDHVQGSRFIPGGYHENTPKSRLWGVKLLHAPLISLASGFHYTDTTNGFRGYSAKLLSSDKLAIFRDCFSGYELHYYLAIEAARQGFSCKEIPVSRIYPKAEKTPTKISPVKGNLNLLKVLFKSCLGCYAPCGEKRIPLKKIATILFFLAAIIFCADRIRYFELGDSFGFDLRFRRNEICCSHDRVNPFRVWNREIQHLPFRGCSRPDMPDDTSGGTKGVQGYPAWHTTYCYFYAWIPENWLVGMFSILYAAIIIGGFLYFKNQIAGQLLGRQCFFWAIALVLIWPIICQSFVLNYGLLIALLFALLIGALQRKQDVLAGILWAVMMIKPQIALLFFWPLFFGRKYRTILIAVGLCVAASLFPAWLYNENPVELFLQIPRVGTPYGGGRWIRALSPMFPHIAWIWSGCCFIACGILSGLGRKCGDWWIRFFPALIFFPVWSYSQGHDHIVRWSLYLFVALATAEVIRFREHHRLLKGLLIAAVCGTMLPFAVSWSITVLCRVFPVEIADPKQIVYVFMDAGNFFLLIVLVAAYIQLIRQDCTLFHQPPSIGNASSKMAKK